MCVGKGISVRIDKFRWKLISRVWGLHLMRWQMLYPNQLTSPPKESQGWAWGSLISTSKDKETEAGRGSCPTVWVPPTILPPKWTPHLQPVLHLRRTLCSLITLPPSGLHAGPGFYHQHLARMPVRVREPWAGLPEIAKKKVLDARVIWLSDKQVIFNNLCFRKD